MRSCLKCAQSLLSDILMIGFKRATLNNNVYCLHTVKKTKKIHSDVHEVSTRLLKAGDRWT